MVGGGRHRWNVEDWLSSLAGDDPHVLDAGDARNAIAIGTTIDESAGHNEPVPLARGEPANASPDADSPDRIEK